MRRFSRWSLAAVALVVTLSPGTNAEAPSPQLDTPPEDVPMTQTAKGTFEVAMKPLDPPDEAGGSTLGRMSIDKTFTGDLEATSKGQMLSATTEVQGSAGYVAIERVTGTLGGRSGSFVLQHTGTMTRGEPALSVTVVPDSASGELAGLSGRMTIDIEDGRHFYGFEYSLPE